MKKLLILLFFPVASFALNLPGAGGGHLRVPVKSFGEIKFGEVVKQKYDFSCGSAALASLLTHHYNMPITEATVFEEMFKYGDKEKIEKKGFSMLDMKKFLSRRGLNSDGYTLKVKDVAKLAMPTIALVNYNGYNHFVVVKGVEDNKVLVGDPSIGMHVIEEEKFDKSSNGIFLFIRDNTDIAKASFNQREDWEHSAPAAPSRMAFIQRMPHLTDLMLPTEFDY
ncbi:C39 family peptidase [Oceanisphaera marina]|uniref:C39 family peptidase n=1 Tax=Oceanisphaera marina TaxID=2017550 RepID=UPI00166D162E|nr:C39 family peptidase [Oceanisphaera marina]